jgi:hypothetical protein
VNKNGEILPKYRGKSWKTVENRGKSKKIVENRGKSWKTMENRGKPWKIVENHGKQMILQQEIMENGLFNGKIHGLFIMLYHFSQLK